MFVFLSSTLIHFTRDQERELFERYLFARQMGEWGVYDSLSPTQKLVIFLWRLRGGGMWVSNDLLVWSILTLVVVVACSITVLFFRPEGVYVPCL